MKNRAAFGVLAAVLAVLFVQYVYPTPWVYMEVTVGDMKFMARVNRYTGTRDIEGKDGWHPMFGANH